MEKELDSYINILKNTMKYDSIAEVKDCCINVLTEFIQYNFCFIEFETEDRLGLWVTHEDFTERLVIIEKKYIVSISVVYMQDIQIEKEDNVCYS